ncbi:MAG: hypothetical protein ACRCVY_03280 [Commensalibacter sp.]
MNNNMLPGQIVKNTNFKQLRPLGLGGQLVIENWHILQEILMHGVGQECAALLLEPVIDRQRGEVDWYLPSPMPPELKTPLTREQLVNRAHQLIEKGRQLATRMVQSSDSFERQKGEMLTLALTIPNDDAIIATPYGPALVTWGHALDQANNLEQNVVGRGNFQPVTSPMVILPPPRISQDQFGNLWHSKPFWIWLISIILLLLLLFMPWITGIIPINYCHYFWLPPLILLVLLGLLLGSILANYNRYRKNIHANR